MRKLKVVPLILLGVLWVHSFSAKATAGGDDLSPEWSPDGNKIAFISNRTGNPDIFVMNADGSDTRNLTHSPETESRFEWSPDSQKIVFEKTSTSSTNQIYLMNADGSDLHKISANATDDTFPKWSPDGSQIAFLSAQNSVTDIEVMEADGSNPRSISNGISGNSSYDFEWSPDGKSVAFATQDQANGQVMFYLADLTSGVLKAVLDHYWYTNATCCAVHWAWSLDGGQIALSLPDDGNIYGYTIATGLLHPLAYVGGYVNQIAWLMDGKRLFYSTGDTVAYKTYPGGSTGVYWVNLADNQIQPITPPIYYGFILSPDQSHLMVVRPLKLDGSPTDMSFYDLATLGAQKADVAFNNIFGWAWSPDSRSVITSICVDGDADIYRVDVDGNTVTNLTTDDALAKPDGFNSQCNGYG